MNAFIEVTPRAVTIYGAAGEVVWSVDLTTQRGQREARKLAAQMLWTEHVPDGVAALRFETEGAFYRVRASADLAARIAAVL